MPFIKEIVPEADKELFNSFEIKDELDEHDKDYIYKWIPERREWVVDREREIYFIFVTGGQNEAHPMQFNLIYNGEKVVLYCTMDTYKTPTKDNPMKLHNVYYITSIVMPKALDGKQETIIEIIKQSLMVFSTKYIRDGRCFDYQDTFDIGKIAKPIFKREINDE
ncbi:MAG: hypothetical protein ACI4JT_01775 [Oscillospiraceae bacterium]